MPKCDNEKTKDREGGDNGETIVIEENKVVSEDKEAPETFRSSRPEVFLRKDVFKICRRTPMPKCDFSKVAEQLY